MKRYLAFLRGVNIRGKHKVPMAELRSCLESLGFSEVKTYLNSGNALFSCEEDPAALASRIEAALNSRFGFAIPVFVMEKDALDEILQNAPDWWGTGDPEIYDDLIFIMPPATFADVLNEIGEPKEGLERVQHCGQAVFWSFVLKDYQKTNWWSKTASAKIGARLTIRTANTVKKMAGM